MGSAQVNGKVIPGLLHWAKEQCCQHRVNLRHHLVSLKLKALNSKLGAWSMVWLRETQKCLQVK